VLTLRGFHFTPESDRHLPIGLEMPLPPMSLTVSLLLVVIHSLYPHSLRKTRPIEPSPEEARQAESIGEEG